MFFEMRFDLGKLDSGERSLPFGLLVSVTMRPTKLKLGTHVDSGWIYRVYIGVRLLLMLSVPIFLHLSFSPILKH